MRTIEEIKAATAALPPDDQFKLFRWWIETDAFRVKQLAALKAEDSRLGLGTWRQGVFANTTNWDSRI